jgi:adenosylcobinamide-phosphate synthase
VNTLDAMVGYRDRFPQLGWGSARLDDLANLVPARITGALLLVAGAALRLDVRGALRCLRADAARTPSPNGGVPMSITAGLLGTRLEKPGVYVLNEAGRPCEPSDVHTAVRLLRVTGVLAIVLLTAILFGMRDA